MISYSFILPILSIIGFIFNLLTIIVFSLTIKNGHRDDMYKHLLFKAICEMFGCLFSAFYPLYYYNGTVKFTFIATFWFIWFKSYFINALFMASIGFEILATFNCAISIEKRMKWCQKRLSFWLSVLFILILSFGIEMSSIFMIKINKSNDTDQFNRTIHIYKLSVNSFASKFDSFGLSKSIIKEVISLIILLTLNSYILFIIVQNGRRKKRLTSNNSNNRNRAEIRKVIMIIVLFLTFLLGHLPNFLFFVLKSYIGSDQFWTDLITCAEIFSYFSYSTSIFVYFCFNNIFRDIFLKLIHFRSF
jgi:hypothetical protein